jgi:hypothetical protein
MYSKIGVFSRAWGIRQKLLTQKLDYAHAVCLSLRIKVNTLGRIKGRIKKKKKKSV